MRLGTRIVSVGAIVTVLVSTAATFAGAADPVDGVETERIEVPSKGFAITPPAGWTVVRDSGSSTLLFEIPKPDDGTYQRTIQVMVFDGPMPIDPLTEERFGKTIVERMTASSPAVSAYRIRSAHRQELNNGQPSIIFYAEFDADGSPLMQMHVLTSSRSRHYLVTYTDVPEHFEGSEAPAFLDVAWNTALSLSTDSAPPMRYEALLWSVAASVAAAVAWAVSRARRRPVDYEALGEGEEYVKSATESEEIDGAEGEAEVEEVVAEEEEDRRVG